jgi:hypothetical protein
VLVMSLASASLSAVADQPQPPAVGNLHPAFSLTKEGKRASLDPFKGTRGWAVPRS